MSYTYLNDGYEIIFFNEIDFLRCRWDYLINYVADASGSISFRLWIERGLYKKEKDIPILTIRPQKSSVTINEHTYSWSHPYYENRDYNNNYPSDINVIADEDSRVSGSIGGNAFNMYSWSPIYGEYSYYKDDEIANPSSPEWERYSGDITKDVPKEKDPIDKKNDIKRKSLFDIIDME